MTLLERDREKFHCIKNRIASRRSKRFKKNDYTVEYHRIEILNKQQKPT